MEEKKHRLCTMSQKIQNMYVLAQYVKCSIQGVSWLEDITAGGDFLGLCDQKSSYKYVSDFGRLRSYDRLKLRREGNDYWKQTEQNNKPA